MPFSTAAIEAMGFMPLPDGEAIEAEFHSLHVFAVRGFTLQDSGAVTTLQVAPSGNYEIGIGVSVNAVTAALLGDSYTDDEDVWSENHKCGPPYAVIHFGPTALQRMITGRVKRDGDELVTYDAFGNAKAELKRVEGAALPRIEMALACCFSSQGRPVQFIPVERTEFGLTPSGTTVHDIRVSVSATGYVSSPHSTGEIEAKLNSAAGMAATLDPRVSRFFQLGLRDADNLKKFLYYFLAIEIEVHLVFRTLPTAAHLQNGAALEPRVQASLSLLIESRDNWKSLADRFVWCVVSVWTHLSDTDIQEFKRLKKIRDAIAHGDLAAPENEAVLAVEQLARKIQVCG